MMLFKSHLLSREVRLWCSYYWQTNRTLAPAAKVAPPQISFLVCSPDDLQIPSALQLPNNNSTKKESNCSPCTTEANTPCDVLHLASSSLPHLKQAHAHLLRRNLLFHIDHSLPSLLLSLYASLSSPSYASAVVSSAPTSSLPLFNCAIRLFSKSRLALCLYALMPAFAVAPDNFTFPYLLNSCASLADPVAGSELHSRLLRSGYLRYLPVANALVDMYGKCAMLATARRVFDEMPVRDIVSHNALLGAHARSGDDMLSARMVFDEMPERNVISWNAMVVGYVNSGDLDSGRAVFDRIPRRNMVSWTLMIVGYCKNGLVDTARDLFDQMPQRNLVSWTAMISGYAQSGRANEALSLFHKMQSNGVKADAATMTGVISAVAQLGSTELARWVGAYVDQKGIERNERVLTALVDMYAKCGYIDKAFSLFEEICSPDAYSFTALINGLASNGHPLEALKVFDEMQAQSIRPDPITFVGVLSACGHAGLVDEGLRFWHSMSREYGIKPCPDHYACMVDILGRAGRLAEAHEMVKSMPSGPHAGALGAMLAACRTHGNVEIAESVARELFVLEPGNTGNYLLLSSIYAEKGLWAEAAGVRKMMKRSIPEKLPGSSWI